MPQKRRLLGPDAAAGRDLRSSTGIRTRRSAVRELFDINSLRPAGIFDPAAIRRSAVTNEATDDGADDAAEVTATKRLAPPVMGTACGAATDDATAGEVVRGFDDDGRRPSRTSAYWPKADPTARLACGGAAAVAVVVDVAAAAFYDRRESRAAAAAADADWWRRRTSRATATGSDYGDGIRVAI